MEEIPVVVLTGGPCSGKTSALSVIGQSLLEMGYHPIFVPEMATIFLSSGVAIPRIFADHESSMKFQELVITSQLRQEEAFLALAKLHPNAVLICDRGAMDGGAYVELAQFVAMLSRLGLNKSDLMSRYAGVVHLVTAADGAREHYNLDNPARYETPDEAVVVDQKLQKAWTGHRKLRIISNRDADESQIDFGKKMDLVVEAVCQIIGIPFPIQSERRFLLPLGTDFGSLPSRAIPIEIIQTYLKSDMKPPNADGLVERRIRQWRPAGEDTQYTYTEKWPREKGGISRFARERRLTADEYIVLLRERDPNRLEIEKTRYSMTYGNLYLHIDHIRAPIEMVTLEVQTTNMQKRITLPAGIEVLREVTDDPYYNNIGIASLLCPLYE